MTISRPEDAGSPDPGEGSTAEEGLTAPGRAMIFGTGLIGGSVGMALRERGWR